MPENKNGEKKLFAAEIATESGQLGVFSCVFFLLFFFKHIIKGFYSRN